MSESVKIGNVEFASKKEAEQHIREILGRYEQMRALEGDDLEIVVALLDQHPNRETIVDCGVSKIVVQHLNDAYSSRRFLAIRTDGSMRDFTWRHSLMPRDSRKSVLRACRWAVRNQIVAFRDKAFAGGLMVCPILGEPISEKICDVDHIAPRTFGALVAAWLATLRLDYSDIALCPQRGYQQPDRWEDPFLEENWVEYHRLHARLRVVHPRANRSVLRKQP